MGWWLVPVVAGGLGWLFLQRRKARLRWLAGYRFPASVKVALAKEYPQLKAQQTEQVLEGLRAYFQLCQGAGKTPLGMPSQAVDKAWHAFILCTREYQSFCQQAFGRYLHHTPHQAGGERLQQRALRQTWLRACRAEGLSTSSGRLVMPTLFALDAALGIPNGFQYRFWPKGERQPSSADDSGTSTVWLTSDGWFGDDSPSSDSPCDSDSSSADSCSDGGGCSGGGCSGGGGD